MPPVILAPVSNPSQLDHGVTYDKLLQEQWLCLASSTRADLPLHESNGCHMG